MQVGVKLGLALVVTAALAGCATGGGDQMSNTVYATHRIVRNLEQTMGDSVSKLNETTAQLQMRVEQSEQTALRLQAMTEENQVKLDKLQTDLSRLTDTLYRSMGLSTGASAPATPNAPVYVPSDAVVTTPPSGTTMSTTEPAEPSPLTLDGNMPMSNDPDTAGAAMPAAGADGASQMDVYGNANQLLQDRKFEEARSAFDSFITQYPASPFTSNALYWKGYCLLKLEKDQDAITEYQKLIEQYPTSDKVPSAYYYQGLAYGRLGQSQLAVEKLRYVVTNYPSSSAAATAQTALEKLRQ